MRWEAVTDGLETILRRISCYPLPGDSLRRQSRWVTGHRTGAAVVVGADNCNSAGPTSGVCGSCSDSDSWGCSEHKTAAQELVAATGMSELRIEESWTLRSSSERCRR